MICFLVSGTNFPLTLALDQTQHVRRWALARGEVIPCCLLSELWPAAPTTASHWGMEQTGQGTGICLGSGCGQWEVEEGEAECSCSTRRDCVVCNFVKCTLAKLLLLPSLSLQVSGTLQPRWGHSTTAFFCLADGVTEVTMFGGSTDPSTGSDEKQSKLADTTLLQFCKCMNMLIHNSTVFRQLIMLIIIT